MRFSALALLLSGGLVAATPYLRVPPQPDLNVDDPASGDPASPPHSISFPYRAPKPDEITNQPAQCDGQAPSDDCFRALAYGSEIRYDRDSECSYEQKEDVRSAVWDAHTLASYSSTFPDVDGARGSAAGRFYMGPDFSEFQGRISGNLRRAADFKTSGSKDYIALSCKDTKNLCQRKSGEKAVGGYAWTKNGWFGYYYYITLCPTYFTIDSLLTKLEQVNDELDRGKTDMATNLTGLIIKVNSSYTK
jgi:hypothetical protein